MIFIIAITFLVVWFLFELKDFIFNGGFANQLAFSLLKITLISCLTVVLSLFTVTVKWLPRILRRAIGPREDDYFFHEVKVETMPSKKKQITDEQKAKRKNSF